MPPTCCSRSVSSRPRRRSRTSSTRASSSRPLYTMPAPPRGAAGKSFHRPERSLMRPLDPVTSKQRVAYGLAFFVLFVALWSWATLGGHVSKTLLANPLTMVQEGVDLLTKQGFVYDIGMTIWRVVGGFTLAAIIAVPLGVLMGAYKPVEAFLAPFVSFARYLHAPALITLLI